MQTTNASIYDFPTYYDLVFGSDTASEMRFLQACFEQFVDGTVERVFEPACGTGRLLYRMGKRGLAVGGIDLNEKAIAYCNERLERFQIEGRAMVGDMSDFETEHPYDASFNTINSFRHLSTESAARGHLESMAQATRQGGIYVLGLHLTPTQGEPTEEEGWTARRGQLAINTYMWPVGKEKAKRIDRYGIRFDIHKPTGSTRIEDVLELRSYTAPQFEELLSAVSSWELVAMYDFAYDIKRPVKLEATSEDIVAILKRC